MQDCFINDYHFSKQLTANNIPQALIIVGARSDDNTYKINSFTKLVIRL